MSKDKKEGAKQLSDSEVIANLWQMNAEVLHKVNSICKHLGIEQPAEVVDEKVEG